MAFAPKRQLAPTEYTVGWICAITTELLAAQAFLDEEPEGPESRPHNDNNDYTCSMYTSIEHSGLLLRRLDEVNDGILFERIGRVRSTDRFWNTPKLTTISLI